jgi:hypothetical protein
LIILGLWAAGHVDTFLLLSLSSSNHEKLACLRNCSSDWTPRWLCLHISQQLLFQLDFLMPGDEVSCDFMPMKMFYLYYGYVSIVLCSKLRDAVINAIRSEAYIWVFFVFQTSKSSSPFLYLPEVYSNVAPMRSSFKCVWW